MMRPLRDLAAEALGYAQPQPRKAKKESKYVPHQGAKEKARRVRQMTPSWLRD